MEIDVALTSARYFAMKKGIELGRTLQNDHPEIANLFIGGNTLTGIVEELNLQSEYGVHNSLACSAVQRTIAGYDGRYTGIKEEYEGLIEEKERRKIGKEHQLRSGLENGRNVFNENKGAFARTPEERREDSRKGYRKGLGKMTREQRSKLGKESYKKGLAKRTTNQRREDCLKGMVERSVRPWTDEEREYIYQLSLNPEYQYSEGANKGRADRELITLEANIRFHDCEEVRTNEAIGAVISQYRKVNGNVGKIGVPIWTDEEREYIYQLSLNPEYQYSEGSLKGKLNRKLIMLKINDIFHDGNQIRTLNAVGNNISLMRKSEK